MAAHGIREYSSSFAHENITFTFHGETLDTLIVVQIKKSKVEIRITFSTNSTIRKNFANLFLSASDMRNPLAFTHLLDVSEFIVCVIISCKLRANLRG